MPQSLPEIAKGNLLTAVKTVRQRFIINRFHPMTSNFQLANLFVGTHWGKDLPVLSVTV